MDTNKRTPSTTWEWRKVKISRRTAAPAGATSEGRPHALPRLSAREPLTVTIVRRGGAEAWWELRARARVWRFPGHLALEDALQQVFEGNGGQRPPAPGVLAQERRRRR